MLKSSSREVLTLYLFLPPSRNIGITAFQFCRVRVAVAMPRRCGRFKALCGSALLWVSAYLTTRRVECWSRHLISQKENTSGESIYRHLAIFLVSLNWTGPSSSQPAESVRPQAEMGLSETVHSVSWSNCAPRTLLASTNLKFIKIFDLRGEFSF